MPGCSAPNHGQHDGCWHAFEPRMSSDGRHRPSAIRYYRRLARSSTSRRMRRAGTVRTACATMRRTSARQEPDVRRAGPLQSGARNQRDNECDRQRHPRDDAVRCVDGGVPGSFARKPWAKVEYGWGGSARHVTQACGRRSLPAYQKTRCPSRADPHPKDRSCSASLRPA